MIDPPKTIQVTPRMTAVIRFTIPRHEMQNVMGPGIEELMDALADQRLVAAGPVFTHHLTMDPNVFDFELGVPVSAVVQPVGHVQPSQWPAIKAVQTMYYGPYEGLPDAWEEFMNWIEAEGLAAADDLWELYLTGPESSPDPTTWRTELVWPLAE